MNSADGKNHGGNEGAIVWREERGGGARTADFEAGGQRIAGWITRPWAACGGVEWLEQFATPARNDFMQFAYLTYFGYLLVLGGVLYYRRDWREYWSVMTYSATGYAVGYVIAILFPIESPWFSMAGAWHGPLQGGPITATINCIEHFGRVRGAAFPSEQDRKSTRLNSSHLVISYAVFCLKKKKN